MKIKYGKGECLIDYKAEEISSIVIKYRGIVTLRHDFMTIDSILDNERALVKNVNRNNMLVHGNNQIHIGFLNNPDLWGDPNEPQVDAPMFQMPVSPRQQPQ